MSFFNFFRNESLFNKGYSDAQAFYEYYQTLDAVKNHIIAFKRLDNAKPQSEKNGWYAFVWEMEQIPAHTEPSKAIPMLEFVSVPSLPSSLPNACVANKPDMGYIDAEIEYYKLLDKGFDIQAIYDWFHMNKERMTTEKPFDYKVGVLLFINKKIIPAMDLKTMYELKAYEKA
jgi:hypothetical protein